MGGEEFVVGDGVDTKLDGVDVPIDDGSVESVTPVQEIEIAQTEIKVTTRRNARDERDMR